MNHTVTQSTFDKPCVPLLDANNKTVADSSFIPVNNFREPVTWNYTVTSTHPTWFHCRQTIWEFQTITPTFSHCQKGGMVFAINPTAEYTFEAFRNRAMSPNDTTSSDVGPTSTSTSPATGNTAAGSGGAVGNGAPSSAASSRTSTVIVMMIVSGAAAGFTIFF
ncbi:hypothetical protein D9611_004981 [Ephemerocybe angulata]|uniref:Uncharacterized protein n=1 Tax=Ephemerocybe angulata TaxID=980116 RepID=A0A8H5EXC6_9AGAR|nr:hypothetical protein D9611_004981 [Tulosesus angulatus]